MVVRVQPSPPPYPPTWVPTPPPTWVPPPSPGGSGCPGPLPLLQSVAADRAGNHAESLPRNYGIVGMWRLGLYTDDGTWDDVSKAAAYGTARVAFRYEADKLDPGHSQVLGLYRWEDGHWVDVGCAAHDAASPVFTSVAMDCLPSSAENIGLFALLQVRLGTTIIIR